MTIKHFFVDPFVSFRQMKSLKTFCNLLSYLSACIHSGIFARRLSTSINSNNIYSLFSFFKHYFHQPFRSPRCFAVPDSPLLILTIWDSGVRLYNIKCLYGNSELFA